MAAYAALQEAEFAAERDGYSATKHQREVGTGYFDLVAQIICRRQQLDHGVGRIDRSGAVPLNASSTIARENVAQDSSALTDSRLAARCAEIAQQAFFDYQTRFNAITRRARERFLARDWAGSFDDAAERLHFYNDVLDGLTSRIRKLMGGRLPERSIWAGIKAVYSSLIARSPAWEIAETFFNSLTRRVFATDGVDQAIEFVDTDFDAPPPNAPITVAKTYRGQSLPELLHSALTDAFEEICWDDLRETANLATAQIEATHAAKDCAARTGNCFECFLSRTRRLFGGTRRCVKGRCPYPSRFAFVMKTSGASPSMPCYMEMSTLRFCFRLPALIFG